ncbi:MAG: RNA polymerase sigma factor [Bacteroidaceae bacterium]|nr:RNA polymerase sigma factor [Bacteroidaceae bacterium]
MNTLTDIALTAQVAAFGSQRAFGLLVQRHQEAVRRTLLRLCQGDAMLADDLAQETFIRAWQGIGGFRQTAGFRTWLLSIAYRVFLDERRRAARYAQQPVADADAAADAPDTLALDIDAAMAVLSDMERTCVTLQCIEGHSIGDIERITGVTANTVKSHLLRGKQKLATYLRNNGYN